MCGRVWDRGAESLRRDEKMKSWSKVKREEVSRVRSLVPRLKVYMQEELYQR